ncbi:hypothetical protein [Lysinibacillus parviboronicapiens]|uniref:hypothetical protein n=1 Tax=Lysinibacillus parviboronicapiens TaxID=436516 RepID=UPI000D39D8D7|nr:hypothetical protein [Lysinibacillus parviboronicapiens]
MKKLFYVGSLLTMLLVACGEEKTATPKEVTPTVEDKDATTVETTAATEKTFILPESRAGDFIDKTFGDKTNTSKNRVESISKDAYRFKVVLNSDKDSIADVMRTDLMSKSAEYFRSYIHIRT